MKRRLLLLGGSFATILIVFLSYYLISEKTSFFHRPSTPWQESSTPSSLPSGRTEIGASEKLQIVDRDPTGRLRAVYRAERTEKTSPDTYKLTHPTVEYYTEDGGATYLWADQGDFQAQDAGGKTNVQRGLLRGNVWIYIERASGRPRQMAEDPQELFRELTEAAGSLPLTRIHTEDIAFDNDRLRMWTDNSVAVFSPEIDLIGQGLTIEWNDRPKELRLLRLHQGEFLVVKGLPEGMNMQLQQTGPGPTPSPAATPASAPAPIAAATTTAPATQTASVSAKHQPPPPAKNIYKLTFLGEQKTVNVDFGDTRLHHAQELSMTFEWGSSWRLWNRQPATGPATTKAPAATKASVAPGGTVAASEAAEASAVAEVASAVKVAASASAEAPTTAPATSPAATQPAGKDRSMYITWSGPLVIEPIGYTPTPDRNRYVISAKGDELELADTRSQAFCREFTYRHPEQTGYLRSTPEQLVRMQFGPDASAESVSVRFDWQQGWARFVGKGQMTSRGGEVSMVSLTANPRGQPTTEPTSRKAQQPNQITWTNYAEARFEPQKPGGETSRMRIKEAEFDGNVELQNADGAQAVRSNHLRVEMAADSQKSDYIRRAVASGDVAAKEQEGNLRAKKQITIDFEPTLPPAAGQPADNRRFRPTTMIAEGDVAGEYRDKKDPKAAPTLIRADRVESDLLRRRHVLLGADERLASIVRGTESIFGAKLTLDELGRTGHAEGPGRIEFPTTDTLSGKLEKPEIAKATWKQGMDFDDEQGLMDVRQDVHLDIGANLDHMECQNLRVRFVKTPTSAPASAPAGESVAAAPTSAPASAPAAGLMDRLKTSQRQIDTVIADDNVTVRSQRFDPNGALSQRVLLTAEKKLFYYGVANRIDVEGPGTFQAEDYRPPQQKAAPAADEAPDAMPQRIDRPWQVAFEWKDHMTFSRAEGNVAVKGEVTMGQRSGKQIAGVHPAFWDQLAEGRQTQLWCETLLAKFPTPTDKTAKTPKKAGAGLRDSMELGELNQITAMDNVRVLDGAVNQTEIRCAMLTYDKEAGIFTIFGSLPDQPAAPAIVTRQTPGEGKAEPMLGERIVYYLKTKEAVVEKPFGSGVR